MKTLRLALEYLAPPLFCLDAEHMGHVEIEELNISSELAHDLRKWDRIYQATFDHSYPPDSGFSSKEANRMLQRSLEEEGKYIYSRLKNELEGLCSVMTVY